MTKFLLVIIIYIAIPAYSLAAMEIADIYIASEGNNKFEAQIKANKYGMQKVVMMIADKMGINYSDIGKVPYLKLKEVFTISSIMNEVSTENHYSATVKYIYDLYNINKLLCDYGTKSVNDKFYQYLILPVFKQRKILNIWDNNNEWNKRWIEARNALEHSKLLYPQATSELMQKINAENIFNLSYENFLEIFGDKLLKKIMLVVCEYFTDIQTGKAFIGLQFIILDYNDQKTIITKEYPLNNRSEVPLIIEQIITSTINQYGHSNKSYNKNANIKLDYGGDGLDDNDPNNQQAIIMTMTLADDNELAEVEKKLKNITAIDKFTITNDYDHKYKVIAMTKSSEFALAEAFYLNGLTYKKYGNIYHLINIQKGF